ncbi:MAG: DMT family transporter [Gammaproteobacteria bacterium]|nr:DMT family transporter [Gammaproteobacteria bacterium]
MNAADRQLRGIACIVVAVCFFSLQDAAIKWLSGSYPLHEIILIRASVAALIIGFVIYLEGGRKILATTRPGLHLARGLLILGANSCFFLALAAMPLAEAMALFFVAPLFITALSALMLGEYVGPRRWFGVALGLVGVLIVLRPDPSEFRLVGLLSVGAAFCYAFMQMITRRLGVTDRASTMAFYVQITFIVASTTMGLTVGDGRFEPTDNPSLSFLLRAWVSPPSTDAVILGGIGILSAIGAYFMSQAYRLSEAAVVAPFEFVALLLAILWGYLFFAELPDRQAAFGMALIITSGLYVLYRQTKYRKASRNEP